MIDHPLLQLLTELVVVVVVFFFNPRPGSVFALNFDYLQSLTLRVQNRLFKSRIPPLVFRPVPIVLVKCWKVAHWNAKKLLKNCQKSKKLLPKFQKLLPKFLAIFI